MGINLELILAPNPEAAQILDKSDNSPSDTSQAELAKLNSFSPKFNLGVGERSLPSKYSLSLLGKSDFNLTLSVSSIKATPASPIVPETQTSSPTCALDLSKILLSAKLPNIVIDMETGPVDETNAAVWKSIWAQVTLQEMPPKKKNEEPTDYTKDLPDMPTGNTAEDERERKRLKRLLRNRVSAQHARERKKAYMNSLENAERERQARLDELENRCKTLEKENEMLREVIRTYTQKDPNAK